MSPWVMVAVCVALCTALYVASCDQTAVSTTDTGLRSPRELPYFMAGGRGGNRPAENADDASRPAFAIEIRRVAVIGDSAALIKSVTRMFNHHDVEVVSASDPATALHVIRTIKAEFALVDVFFGAEPAGVPLIEALRDAGVERIGAMSGAFTDELEAACLAAGASWTVNKPFSRAQLFEALIDMPVVPALLRRGLTVQAVKHLHVERVLEHERGNVSSSARELGVPRQTVQRWLKERSESQD